MTETMTLNMGNFATLSSDEMLAVDGGGFVAALYAAAFVAGTTPLGICVGAGLVLIGTGCCIYGIVTH